MLKVIDMNKLFTTTNIREEADEEIRELAKDIEKNGLLQPLVVRASGAKYEVIAGHRRLIALKMIHEPCAECNIIECSDSDREELQLAENIQRKNMSAVELVKIFDKMKKKGYNNTTIAALINKSISWVSNQYMAAKELDRLYGGDIPEDMKKLSAPGVLKRIKVSNEGEVKKISGNGFSVVQRGHKYTVFCSNFEAETALKEFFSNQGVK